MIEVLLTERGVTEGSVLLHVESVVLDVCLDGIALHVLMVLLTVVSGVGAQFIHLASD